MTNILKMFRDRIEVRRIGKRRLKELRKIVNSDAPIENKKRALKALKLSRFSQKKVNDLIERQEEDKFIAKQAGKFI